MLQRLFAVYNIFPSYKINMSIAHIFTKIGSDKPTLQKESDMKCWGLNDDLLGAGS